MPEHEIKQTPSLLPQALNFQITLILTSICVGTLGIVITFITMGLGLFLMIPVWFTIWIIGHIWQIQACVAAYSGRTYLYPFNIRFFN